MIERTQPVVNGLDSAGELVWGIVPMARWHMQMFRVKYTGALAEQWMLLNGTEKGLTNHFVAGETVYAVGDHADQWKLRCKKN